MIVLPPVTLVLGGARSGKSAHAEGLIEAAGGGVYLATAGGLEAGLAADPDMAARVARHRARRGPGWETVEEPLELARALPRAARAGRPVLVDCVTVWLANVMQAGRDPGSAVDGLVKALPGLAAPVVFVSNEVGLGGVAMDALARAFQDAQGDANRRLAAAADRVVLVAAGLLLTLKDAAAAR